MTQDLYNRSGNLSCCVLSEELVGADWLLLELKNSTFKGTTQIIINSKILTRIYEASRRALEIWLGIESHADFNHTRHVSRWGNYSKCRCGKYLEKDISFRQRIS